MSVVGLPASGLDRKVGLNAGLGGVTNPPHFSVVGELSSRGAISISRAGSGAEVKEAWHEHEIKEVSKIPESNSKEGKFCRSSQLQILSPDRRLAAHLTLQRKLTGNARGVVPLIFSQCKVRIERRRKGPKLLH